MNLKKVYSKHVPPKGFIAIVLLFWMVVREEYCNRLEYWMENHENIHFEQEKELAFIFFYLLFAIEYVIKFAVTWNFSRAYRSVSLEQEAYANMFNHFYLNGRRHYAFVKYIFTLNHKKS